MKSFSRMALLSAVLGGAFSNAAESVRKSVATMGALTKSSKRLNRAISSCNGGKSTGAARLKRAAIKRRNIRKHPKCK